MKRVISLIIPIGLLAILLPIIYSPTRASDVSFNHPAKNEGITKPEQAEPPWYPVEGWHYRRPIIISNDRPDWLDYQVLIKLDNGNFNFSQAKPDGSDVLFTLGQGTIPIPYWIESWDSQSKLAYLWVRVPLDNGDTTIYLYYGNPDAISASDGITTFDGFEDDWSQFAGLKSNLDLENQMLQSEKAVDSHFVWSTISGSPYAESGILSLPNGSGIKSSSSFQFQLKAVGFRANYGSGGSGNEWVGFIDGESGKRTMIGDLPSDPTNMYLRNYNTAESNTILPRIGSEDWHGDYHIYEVRWCNQPNNCELSQSVGDIDHGAMRSILGTQVPVGISLPVTLYNNNSGSSTTLSLDWIYVRQYGTPEPTFVMGEEQGLVELSINNIDTPDPLPAGKTLTYQLTISNTSTIHAPGVVVTDTIQGNFQIGSVSPSQGNCLPGSVILCDLNMIPANSMAYITIIVTPTVDGVITNTAEVGSPGYEFDLNDNHSEQTTLVDSLPPTNVEWIKPVGNEGTYQSYGRPIILEASAEDNDQIDYMVFWWYDHINNIWTSFKETTPPYNTLFMSNELVPGVSYWFEVIAYDRAGNPNDPNQRIFIYIVGGMSVFLPVLMK